MSNRPMVEKLQELIQQAAQDPYLGKWVKPELPLSARNPIWNPAGEMVGFFTLEKPSNKYGDWRDGNWAIKATWVSPEWRNQGLASWALADWIEQRRYANEGVYTFIDDTNLASQRVFTHAGFERFQKESREGRSGHFWRLLVEPMTITVSY